MSTTHIILPVRDLAEQAARCVRSLVDQLRPGDRLTVIDDHSRDDVAALGDIEPVELVRVVGDEGPYAARHGVASTSDADHLLFVDARCRARTGLLDAHRRLLSRPGVALSCTGTNTLPGHTFAGRVAAWQQPFTLAGKVGVPGRSDFFPTANLGVRASAYRDVGGFRQMRSGADADLCWRIQAAGLGDLAAEPTILMDWEPRSSWADLRSQWSRYGQSTAYLGKLYPAESPGGSSVAGSSIAGSLRGTAQDAGRRIARLHPSELPVFLGSLAISAEYLLARRRAQRRLGQYADPVCFGDTAVVEQVVGRDRAVIST